MMMVQIWITAIKREKFPEKTNISALIGKENWRNFSPTSLCIN